MLATGRYAELARDNGAVAQKAAGPTTMAETLRNSGVQPGSVEGATRMFALL